MKDLLLVLHCFYFEAYYLLKKVGLKISQQISLWHMFAGLLQNKLLKRFPRWTAVEALFKGKKGARLLLECLNWRLRENV